MDYIGFKRVLLDSLGKTSDSVDMLNDALIGKDPGQPMELAM